MKLMLLLTFLIITACSNQNIAGNSSETGNCRIVGVASLSSNSPADSVPVVLVSSKYTGHSNEIPDTAWTNENGHFRFDAIPPGEWTISIVDQEQNEGLIRQNILLERGDTVAIIDTLAELGAVRVRRTAVTDSCIVSIQGTPWSAPLSSGEASIVFPELPSNEPISVILLDSEGNTMFMEELLVAQKDTLELVFQKRLLVLHGTGEEHYHKLYETSLSRAEFVSHSVDVDTMDITEYSQYDLLFIVGTPYITNDVLEILKKTELSIVSAVPATFPLLDMTGNVESRDFGTKSTANLFLTGEHSITLDAELGVNKSIQVVTSEFVSYGLPGGNAVNIGTFGNDGSSGLFVYEKGDSLVNAVAPGKRAGIFANGSGLTSEGEKLLEATIRWAGK